MTDPLSVAASIISITVPALHCARLLFNDLSNIIDAPQTVQTLKDDVASVETALYSLRGVEDSEWEVLGQAVADQCKTAIKNCEKACNSFRSNLQRWTRHSRERKLAWQDRAKVGFFKERQIKAMSAQLQSCKIAFNSAIGVATLYSSIRHSHVTEEIRRTISTRAVEVSNAIASTDTQLAQLEQNLGEVRLAESSREQDRDAQDAQDVTDTVQQLEEEQAVLDCSRSLLETLLLKAQEDAVTEAASKNQSQSLKITFGNQNNGIQVGIMNGGSGGFGGFSFGAK